MALRVAYDMTPTLDTRTGIGSVVAHMYDSLGISTECELKPYTLSMKARGYKNDLPYNNVFVPYPARVLLKAWKFSNKLSLNPEGMAPAMADARR